MAKHKARAKLKGDVTTVKAIINHPMETGLRKDKSGKLVPAHYITEIQVTLNGVEFANINSGPAVSKNPLMHFEFKGGKKGEKVKLSWVDNKGQKDSVEATIK